MKQTKSPILLILGMALTVVASGCATLVTRNPECVGHVDPFYGINAHKPYPGVRGDVQGVGECVKELGRIGQSPAGFTILAICLLPAHLIDLPLSAVLDTILLPTDLYRLSRLDKQGKEDTQSAPRY